MIENVTRSLAAALPGCTAEEIADVLWLLTARYIRGEAPLVMPDGSERQDLSPVPAPGPIPYEAEAEGTEVMEAAQSELTLAQGGDSSPGGQMVPAIEVGLRSPEPTTRPLSTARALAQFKRIHGPGPLTVDIEATVEATADARRLVVVTNPGRERGLDVALVVDSSLVMSVCHGELAEFEALLRRAGAFRSVTRWTLVPDLPPHQAPDSRAAGPGPDVMIRDSAGVEHHTDRLLDPSGRRLVLLATDAVADHWYRAGVWQAIQRWAQVMPTAVIDVLPEQYRAQTALGMPAAVMRSRRPAGPNAAADVQVAWWEADLYPEGDLLTAVPLPVVALRPQALEVWAEAIAAAGTAWIDVVWAQRPPGPSPSEANANLTAEDRVQAFLARASRDAQALARILAMAPVLTLPLIRVLQAGLLPGTGSSELTEVLIGGLIERVPGQADRNGPGQFRFRPAIRELLLRGRTATQEWDTHKVITEYLKQDARTGGDIHALLADLQGSAEVDLELEPFAALEHEVASRLGLRMGKGNEPSGQNTEEPETVPAEKIWAVLADRVREGQVTPVIGPLLARGILGSHEDIARRWVRDSRLPVLAQSQGDLTQVAQYVRVRNGDDTARTQLQWQLRGEIRRRRDGRGQDWVWDLGDWLVAGRDPSPAIMEVGRRLRTNDADDSYRILAELNTSVYVTTDWTDLLCDALKENGREPIRGVFKWQHQPEPPTGEWPLPTPQRPLVYHLFGRLDDLSSLVLSEDDYFAWLYAWAIRRKSVPASVLKALTAKSLLFLGYRLDDWDFRVVFRTIWNRGGSALLRRNQHVGVSSMRESQAFERMAAKEYMESYFGHANVSIYWGETREFLSQLRRGLAP